MSVLSAELSCGKTKMALVLPITSFQHVNLTELQLNSPTCPISHNSTHLTASISLDGCGTKTLVTWQIYAFNSIFIFGPESFMRGRYNHTDILETSTKQRPKTLIQDQHWYLPDSAESCLSVCLSSSILVQSWFTSTPCKVRLPPLWSKENHPSSSLWRAASLESRPRDQCTG